MTDHCTIHNCRNSSQYHVKFTDQQNNYISSTYSYCSDHTKIGWFQPKAKKWIGGWIPHNIHSLQDNYGDELTLSAVKSSTSRY